MIEFKNISIRNKLIIIQTATAFIAVLICCAIFVFNNIKEFKNSAIAGKNSIAEIVGINAAPALEFVDRDAANEMLQKLQNNGSILNAVILDKKGNEFARYNKPGEEAFLFPSPDVIKIKRQNRFNRQFLVSYRISNKDFLGTVLLRSEIIEFNHIILSYLKIAVVILFASLLAAFIISTLLQRTITNRLLSLVSKTREVAETGNYSIRVSEGGHDEMGILSGAFNNMLDQTERIQKTLDETNAELEERVSRRTAQLEAANKELESFSYSVSHDLRAPVRAINGYTNIIREDYAEKFDNEGRRILDAISKNAKNMGQLIDDLLAFSHLGRQDLKKSSVSMYDMVTTLCDDLKNDQNLTNSIEFHIGELPTIYGDSVTLKQVWTNLISNAIKYSKLRSLAIVEIGSEIKENEIVYYVKDNGDGFDMKYVDKLFGVFQRLHTDKKFEGTGVGLAIVHRIITKHGGRVWAEGKVDNGATFYFSLNKLS